MRTVRGSRNVQLPSMLQIKVLSLQNPPIQSAGLLKNKAALRQIVRMADRIAQPQLQGGAWHACMHACALQCLHLRCTAAVRTGAAQIACRP